jgi:outer membrane protein OmpA-like peptidoglycan-associated protein
MKSNLVETVKFCFTSEVISQLSAATDERDTAVIQALEKAIPLVLNAILAQTGPAEARAELLELAREADEAGILSQLSDLPAATWHEPASNLLLDLLGDTYRQTVNHLAAGTDIRPAAAGTLLEVAAAAVLGVLGRFAADNHLTPSEFIGWLQAQKAEIAAALLPGTPSPATDAVAAPAPPRTPVMRRSASPPRPIAIARPAPAPTPATGQVWQWGLLLLAVAGLSYYIGRDHQPTPAEAALATPGAPAPAASPTTASDASIASPVAGRYDQDLDTYIYDTGRPITLTLADGTTQQVGANSTENRLYTFLATPSVQVDSVNRTKGWINFDRVNFEPAKATLLPSSDTQLRNVAHILRNFPRAVVKIGGYTDSTGVPLQNQQISEERAKTALLTLAQMGVNSDHLQAKGYGAKHFVGPNNTPAGRALNRRISVRVIKK